MIQFIFYVVLSLPLGSADTSVRIWEFGESRGGLFGSNKKRPSIARIKYVLTGHDDVVTCVTVSSDLGIVLRYVKKKIM